MNPEDRLAEALKQIEIAKDSDRASLSDRSSLRTAEANIRKVKGQMELIEEGPEP